MENKLFENAKFGKVYKTEDGRKAIYVKAEYSPCNDRIYLFLEGDKSVTAYSPDGEGIYVVCQDIISEWQEPIDEDELDRLAEQSEKEQIRTAKQCEALGQCYGFDFQTGFKAGYRRAKDE